MVYSGGGDDDLGAVFNLRYFTGRSIDDALAASVSGETFLFGITCKIDDDVLASHVKWKQLRPYITAVSMLLSTTEVSRRGLDTT